MATNFASAAYVAALQALLDRHEVPVVVHGFRAGRDYEKIDTPIAELMVEDFECTPCAVLRSIEGVLRAGLLVMRRLDDDDAEEVALQLAFDVATALVDEVEPDGVPVMTAGPIRVLRVEPEQPDGVLRNRVCGFLVSFEQDWRITRTNQPTEPEPLVTLYVGHEPNVGPEHVGGYSVRVPVPYPKE